MTDNSFGIDHSSLNDDIYLGIKVQNNITQYYAIRYDGEIEIVLMLVFRTALIVVLTILGNSEEQRAFVF